MASHRRNRLRPLLGVLLLGALAFVFTAVVDATDALIRLLERAQAVSDAAYWLTVAALGGFVIASIAVLMWWFWPRRATTRRPAIDEPSLRDRVARQSRSGVDVSAAMSELDELDARRRDTTLFVAVFGEVSAGKSSVIGALVDQDRPVTDVRAGTTRATSRHAWQTPAGDTVQLIDAPGFADEHADATTARDEALRAHLVIYVCAGDLTRSQWQELATLIDFGKPVVVAVNKADRYRDDELDAIRQSIAERFGRGQRPRVVPVVAGGHERVTRVTPDGQEQTVQRPRPTEVAALREALQAALVGDPTALTALRDHAVFRLASDKADTAERAHQDAEAEHVVARHTRAAVIGALAALSPGSDLVIQGVIGARLVRQLCELFGVRARDVDVDAVLKTAGSRARNSSALVLAVAGNALKAFPGLGTITGGLAHAVAYGLLFDAFGRALARSLRETGALKPEAVADELDAALEADLASRARRIAVMALRSRSERDTS